MGKRWKTSILLFLVVAWFLVPGGAAVQAKEPYKVGAIFAITGPASWLGEPERNTALMIADSINRAGGINGHPLEVIIYDTVGDETKTLLATKRLIEKDKVLAIIGPSRSGTSLAIVPTIQKAKVPLVSCAASIRIVTPVKERKWVFKTPQTDVQAAERIYDYMKGKGIRKVAIITISTGFGDSGRAQLKRLAPAYGINIVADERYGPKDVDLTAQLTRIRASGAQALINWSIGPTQVLVVKNYRQLGMTIPLFQSHGFGSKKNIQALGKDAEGIIFPAGRLLVADKLPYTNRQRPLLTMYKNDYESRFKSPVSTFGGHAWDALMLVVEALREVGPDKAKIRDYLENRKDFIGTGGIFNFSPQDHNGLTKDAFEMLTVKGGDWALAQ